MDIFKNYHSFDYTNGFPICERAKPKEFRDEVFTNFLCELPSRLLELRKVIPQEITMDFSYKSLEEIDKWYIPFIYQYYRDGVIPDLIDGKEWYIERGYEYDVESGLFRIPIEFRSLAYDLAIYLVETLRRIAMDDIHWVIGHGKVNKVRGYGAAGHPRACSEKLKDSQTQFNDVDRGCVPVTFLILMYTGGVAQEDGNKNFKRLLSSFYRNAFNLYSDDVIPEHLLYPRY